MSKVSFKRPSTNRESQMKKLEEEQKIALET
jgi:hypothetical protein